LFIQPQTGFQGGVELLSKVGAAIGVVLAFVVAGYVFKSIRPAPASRPSSADLRQDISRKHNERVQNDIQDQEREARKERERERRRELIMAVRECFKTKKLSYYVLIRLVLLAKSNLLSSELRRNESPVGRARRTSKRNLMTCLKTW
jgi:hypothetical protein